MSATIHDVAREAGVSASTVSRAMTGGTVNAGTRAMILQVATRMGYRVNRSARGLTTGRTGNLGLLVPDLSNPFFADLIKGAAGRARASDHPLFVSDTEEHVGRERETIESLLRSTDGLLVCSPRGSDDELREVLGTTPAVIVNRRVPGLPSVTADAESGIQQAVQHLGALGHRRIAYVAGPTGSWSDQERSRGLRSAEELGLEVVEVRSAAPTFASGVLAADVLLTTGATAVIAFNDLLALGILHRLTSRGVRVPDEMSVVGHDDIDMASMCSPQLTTVAVPKEQLGAAAAELLLRLLADRPRGGDPEDDPVGRPGGGDAQHDLLLPSTLVVRGSTAVAPPTIAGARP